MPTFIEEARKDQIIGAALELINEKENAAISIGDIARKTGISKGNITYYFKTKDEIIRHVLIKIIQITAEEIVTKVERKRSYRNKITTYVSLLLAYWMNKRHGYECMVQLLSSLTAPEEKEKFHKNVLRATVGYIDKLLKGGVQAGEFKISDTKETALLIHSSIDGVLYYWILDDRFCNYNKVAKKVVLYVNSLLSTK